MTTNEVLKQIHAAILKKVQVECKVAGNKVAAFTIADRLISYANSLTAAFSDDGEISDVEAEVVTRHFDDLLKLLPDIDHKAVGWAWDGLSICFIKVFDGLKTYLSKWFGLVFPSVLMVALCATLTGCKAFYENSGTNLAVGEITAPVEFSEPSESLTVRVLFNMTGAKVWTAKDALVTVNYRNAYTNSYLYGMADKQGAQDFGVEVQPCVTTPTNSVPVID